MLQLDETIVAIASAPGGALRGIIRLSGSKALTYVTALLSNDEAAAVAALRLPHVIDVALQLPSCGRSLPARAYVWPTLASYTRQPTVELHLVGSPPLLDIVVRELVSQGARLATPGEFTLRAFLAGRLDLTQAEAVLGVIDASDRRQFDAALEQLAGGLAAPLKRVRSDLLDLLADLEAGLDFVEEDIEFVSPAAIAARLADAQAQVETSAQQLQSRRTQGAVPRVVLAGAPNAGKSSLFNALAGREAALVSETPGATRDYLVAEVEFAGLPALLIDTAGVDEHVTAGTPREIQVAAQAHGQRQRELADVLLICLDSTLASHADIPIGLEAFPETARLVLHTKCDLPRKLPTAGDAWPVSARTGFGLPQLREAIRQALVARMHDESNAVAGTAVRCYDSLRLAAECLARATEVQQASAGDELLAIELRIALDELGKVAGVVYTDDVLDRVFGRFCIGK